ncbi:membrane glycosyltransferase [Azotobacter beijerinckii]|uniref:Glucans biosynthesis glucosyltransferase H n=1 Tax=Azotobacter beijerinckii TaxID=170623 RepID=A0A1H6TFD2_9GAMM|nr:glucans biosynthesis glucosyltransferase MdoH [Azotobacter beijerinckii]SEI78738.1 membrane glycosyltransferase [Azotobacter beijerinckii]
MPKNNPTSLQTPLDEYLRHLPLAKAERERLADAGSLAELHRRLGGDAPAALDDAALGSAARRLAGGYGDALAAAGALDADAAGRACLAAAPPIRRTRVIPEPWGSNLLLRAWRRLTGRGCPPAPPRERPPASWQQLASLRRLVLMLLMFGPTALATWYMMDILPCCDWSSAAFAGGPPNSPWHSLGTALPYLLEGSVLTLFALLFGWVSAGFWTAVMGFWELLRGRDRQHVSAAGLGTAPIPAEARTAIVMPICNEDVARAFAGLRATYESLAASGELERFDLFILSDSGSADIAAAEQQAWLELCRETGGFGRIFYRRRRRRVKRKSGNIDDFCRRWGSQYRYMVVMDADSVMSGDCLTTLVRLMEANPEAGIIQTAPKASGRDTLYARMQQFATRVYGPLLTAGMHFWQLGESHYWGHNAIIRMAPFIEHCALAPLPGRGVFAGAILSHDFVEAALMRRAGWGVWVAYDLPGSYEELPPNLLDELKRDRRWCHGNLMNFRLFLVRGMHPVHRAVFLTGVMSYLSAPLWFAFLLLSTALMTAHQLLTPQALGGGSGVFPIWTPWYPQEAMLLFYSTLTMLVLPKLLSLVLVWVKGAGAYGGALRVTLSLLLEMVCSMLLAPVRMFFHSCFVIGAFLGRSVQWKSPRRDDGSTSWGEALRRHGSQTLLGLAWALLVGWLDPRFLGWLAPIIGALTLSIPVSVISSRVGLGRFLRERKLFLIPEEHETPAELCATERYTRENRRRAQGGAFVRAVVDPLGNALACAMATARHGRSAAIERLREERVEHALAAGPERLDGETRLALLGDPVALARLHLRLWEEGWENWLAPWRRSLGGLYRSGGRLPAALGEAKPAVDGVRLAG